MSRPLPLPLRFLGRVIKRWEFYAGGAAPPAFQALNSWWMGRDVELSFWRAALVALVVAAYLEWRDLALQIDPRLELSLPTDSDSPGFHQSWGSWEQVQVGWDPETEEPVYQSDDSWEIYRARVRNLSGSKTIRNVKLQLKAVTPDTWGPAGKISSFPISLHPQHLS